METVSAVKVGEKMALGHEIDREVGGKRAELTTFSSEKVSKS